MEVRRMSHGLPLSTYFFANSSNQTSRYILSIPFFSQFGFNLVIYPDEEIQVATKPSGASGGGLGKWFSELLSPVDTSEVKK